MQIVLAAGASQYCHHERGRRNESKIRVCDHQFPSCRKNLRQRVTNSSRFFEIFPYPNFIPLFPFLDIKIHIYIHIYFLCHTARRRDKLLYGDIFVEFFESWFNISIVNPPPPSFFLASSIPPFNSKPPRNLLFIHTPSEKLFIAFTSRNLPLSLFLHASPQNLVEILSPRCKCAHSVPKILRFPTFATYTKPRQNQNFYFPRNCTARLSPQSALSF